MKRLDKALADGTISRATFYTITVVTHTERNGTMKFTFEGFEDFDKTHQDTESYLVVSISDNIMTKTKLLTLVYDPCDDDGEQ